MTQADVLTAIDDALETGRGGGRRPGGARAPGAGACCCGPTRRSRRPSTASGSTSAWRTGFPKPRRLEAAVGGSRSLQPGRFVADRGRAVLVLIAALAGRSRLAERRRRRVGGSGGSVCRASAGGGAAAPAEPADPSVRAGREAGALARRPGRAAAVGSRLRARRRRPQDRAHASRWSSRRPSTRCSASRSRSPPSRTGTAASCSARRCRPARTPPAATSTCASRRTRLRPALRDLAALADVRSQSQTGRDVTPRVRDRAGTGCGPRAPSGAACCGGSRPRRRTRRPRRSGAGSTSSPARSTACAASCAACGCAPTTRS